MPEKSWKNVQWVMPEWAAKLFWEELKTVCENTAQATKVYREEMENAMGYVCESDVPNGDGSVRVKVWFEGGQAVRAELMSTTPTLDAIGRDINDASLINAINARREAEVS